MPELTAHSLLYCSLRLPQAGRGAAEECRAASQYPDLVRHGIVRDPLTLAEDGSPALAEEAERQRRKRNRAAVAEELRRLLPKMEGFDAAKTIPIGISAIDRHLPQEGLAGGALHEFVPEEGGAIAATLGFMAALLVRFACLYPPGRERLSGLPGMLPLIFVLPAYGFRQYGRLYGHGLAALGLHPDRIILVETVRRTDTLWAVEEALHSGVPAAVAAAIDKLDLKLSQRLQFAAQQACRPLLLLREAQHLESSAAATRWRIGTAAAARDRFGFFARSKWRLNLERCRNGRSGEWLVEYNHVAHCFSLAAALADSAPAVGADEKYGKYEKYEKPLRRAGRS
jgi:protein ImuA